jgi:hypothetical protein
MMPLGRWRQRKNGDEIMHFTAADNKRESICKIIPVNIT